MLHRDAIFQHTLKWINKYFRDNVFLLTPQREEHLAYIFQKTGDWEILRLSGIESQMYDSPQRYTDAVVAEKGENLFVCVFAEGSCAQCSVEN